MELVLVFLLAIAFIFCSLNYLLVALFCSQGLQALF